jgi:uncharacterized protein (DUF433 family)
MEKELLKRITIIPGLMGGRPTIRGMRFKVSDVLGYLSAGMTEAEILEDFPYLEKEDIIACLEYASKKLDHTVILVSNDAA